MSDREALLRRLVVGDIFHARFLPVDQPGPSLICLVTSVTESSIQARTVTTQFVFQFDVKTGEAESIDERAFLRQKEEKAVCAIVSIAPLPVDIYNVMLGIDRKFRLESVDRNPERIKLNDAEKQALIFAASHYPENPL
jgi:hypothetical protein